MSARRPHWKNLLFALVAMALGLVALELAAGLYFVLEERYWPRILSPEPEQNQTELKEYVTAVDGQRANAPAISIPMQASDTTEWGLSPGDSDKVNGMRVNSLGLRGGEIGTRQPKETRMLFLGDSSIAGVGCPENLTTPVLAAMELRGRLQRPAVSINGGVPGFDSGKSLTQLRGLLPELKPDWVIVANLWSDCYSPSQSKTEAASRSNSLLSKTNTYRLLRRLLSPFLTSRKVGWFASKEEMLEASIKDARVKPDQYFANLVAMATATMQAGARPIFLVLPAPIDLSSDGAPPIVVEYRDLMRRAARETGALIIDGPSLLTANQIEVYDFIDAVHPGPEMHQVLGVTVARTIANEMARSNTAARH